MVINKQTLTLTFTLGLVLCTVNLISGHKLELPHSKQIIFLEKFIELFCGFNYTKPYFGSGISENQAQAYGIVFVDDYDKCSNIFDQSCEFFELTQQNAQAIKMNISEIIPNTDIEKKSWKLFDCLELTNKTIGSRENFHLVHKVTNTQALITHWDWIPQDKKSEFVPRLLDSIHPEQLHLVINHFIPLTQPEHHHHLINSVNQNQVYRHTHKLDKFHHYVTPTHIKIIDNLKIPNNYKLIKSKAKLTKKVSNKFSNIPLNSPKLNQNIGSGLYTGKSQSKLKHKQKLLVITLCSLFGWCGIAGLYVIFRYWQIWCLSRQIPIHPSTANQNRGQKPKQNQDSMCQAH